MLSFIRTALQHQQPNYCKHFKSPHSFIHLVVCLTTGPKLLPK